MAKPKNRKLRPLSGQGRMQAKRYRLAHKESGLRIIHPQIDSPLENSSPSWIDFHPAEIFIP